MRDAQLCKAVRELLLHEGEARPHDLGMLGHVSLDAGKIFEKARMSELRELLGAHALDSECGADPLDVLVARRDKRDARTREGHLGRGAKLVHQVVGIRLRKSVKDVKEHVVLLAKAMHGVGVVPVDTKVASRRP